MNYCPFCDPEIIKNQVLFETDTEVVLYNNRRSNKGRCVVVPKRHISSIRDFTKEELSSFFRTVQKVSEKLNDYLKPDGFNYGLNEGEVAGQTIEHLHFHILPRWVDDLHPEFHLFHGDPAIKQNLSKEEHQQLTTEFRNLFREVVI